MTSSRQRLAAGASIAALLSGSLATAAFAADGEPPYNQDGITDSFLMNCYTTTDLIGDAHYENVYDQSGNLTPRYLDPTDPDDIVDLKNHQDPWFFQNNTTLGLYGFGEVAYPFPSNVTVAIGTGDNKLPENPMPGDTYEGPIDAEISFTLPKPYHFGFVQAGITTVTGTTTSTFETVFPTSTGAESLPITTESDIDPLAVPAFTSGDDIAELELTTTAQWTDLTIPENWSGDTADLIMQGDNALIVNAVGTDAGGQEYQFNLACYPAEAAGDQDAISVTIGELAGNYTPPAPPEPCGGESVVPTAGNDESAAFYRFASKNRVLTALYAAKNTSGWCDTAILASSVDYADALAAAPLADALDAPILLANADGSLDPQVQSYLANEFDFVIIASGPGVIPESTRNGLNDALTLAYDGTYGDWYAGNHTARVAGVNRYETAATLAVATLVAKDDPTSETQFILADGQNFPDALAAGPAAAAATNGVILLTAGDTGVPSFTSMFLPGHSISFSGATLAYLPGWIPGWPTTTFDWSAIGGFNHQTITVVGGAAKAAAEAGMLGMATEPVEYDDALVGADRYETATLVATKYFTSAPTYYTLASGEDFPDAVVAGGWAANADGPLVLTRNAALPQVTMDYLVDVADNGDAFVVFGGTGSVSRNVSDQLQDTFQW